MPVRGVLVGADAEVLAHRLVQRDVEGAGAARQRGLFGELAVGAELAGAPALLRVLQAGCGEVALGVTAGERDGVAGKGVVGDAVVVRRKLHDVAGAEVAGAQPLGVRHPVRRLQRALRRHERDLVDGDPVCAVGAGHHGVPLPACVAGHVGGEAVGGHVAAQPGHADVLADFPVGDFGQRLPRSGDCVGRQQGAALSGVAGSVVGS